MVPILKNPASPQYGFQLLATLCNVHAHVYALRMDLCLCVGGNGGGRLIHLPVRHVGIDAPPDYANSVASDFPAQKATRVNSWGAVAWVVHLFHALSRVV